ncbi:MAG: glycosyltransferase family 4 protein [Calditrichaeota bacterium]|nr:glycosyltransferase family 4 protein [Calditrichota bacterium]
MTEMKNSAVLSPKILMVSYTSFMQKFYQTLPQEIARQSGATVKMLVPPFWKELWSGQKVHLETRDDALFATQIGDIVGAGNLHFAMFRNTLASLLKSFQPDVIDLEDEPFNLGSFQMAFFRNRYAPDAKLVLHASQHQFKNYPPPFRWTEKYALNHADAVLCRNQDAVDVLCKKSYSGPLEIVTHGVDTAAFQPRELPELRREISPDGKPIVGFVGAMAEHKGLKYLVEAMADLPATLLLIGGGEEKSRLQEQAAALNVTAVFLPPAKHDAVARYMSAMDIFVLPSLTRPNWVEKFGRVIIEAMASGTPVIGSSSGEIPNVIGDAGLVFTEADAADLRKKIRQLLENPEQRRAFREKGLQRVHKKYSWQAVAAQTLAIYERLL